MGHELFGEWCSRSFCENGWDARSVRKDSFFELLLCFFQTTKKAKTDTWTFCGNNANIWSSSILQLNRCISSTLRDINFFHADNNSVVWSLSDHNWLTMIWISNFIISMWTNKNITEKKQDCSDSMSHWMFYQSLIVPCVSASPLKTHVCPSQQNENFEPFTPEDSTTCWRRKYYFSLLVCQPFIIKN